MEFKDLVKMTSTKLREEALKHPEIKGVHGMNKDQLIDALKKVLGITAEATKQAQAAAKTEIKRTIRTLKTDRAAALSEGNRIHLVHIRKKIKRLKRQLKKAS